MNDYPLFSVCRKSYGLVNATAIDGGTLVINN